MFFEEWILGPQLTGAVMLLSGLGQKIWPPKQINDLYGYRSDRSKSNQQTWDEGNRYSADLLIRYSIAMIAIGLVTDLVPTQLHISEKTFVFIKIGLMIASAIGAIVAMFTYTERHLKQLFPDT